MSDLFRRAFARHASRVAVATRDNELTFAELSSQAAKLAHGLRGRGIRPGDPVVLLLRNSIEFVIADIALVMCGACKVPLNDMLSANNVSDMIVHCGAVGIIAHSSFAAMIGKISSTVDSLKLRLGVADDAATLPNFEDMADVTDGQREDWPKSDGIQSSMKGLIIYTGGTTGKSKGVVHTQQALCLDYLSHIVNLEMRSDERLLVCSPLPHSAQLFVASALLNGAMAFIETGFDAGDVLEVIERERLTLTFMVPTMIYRILDHPDIDRRDTSSLRTMVYGASPITPTRLNQAISRFGLVLLQIYGQTEIPNLITTLSKSDHGIPEYQTSCGQAVIFCDVAILDDEGNHLDSGEVGEVAVRSNYSLEAYHDNPKATSESYVGSYLRTGDLGHLSETGHLYLVDRAKDMIISGGMNVYSTEVENIAQRFTGVGQIVVIGIPDEDWGEAVTAFVVPSTDSFDTTGLRSYCKEHLAKYKVPKTVQVVSEIPLTAYGKPDKKALRAKFWGDGERQIN